MISEIIALPGRIELGWERFPDCCIVEIFAVQVAYEFMEALGPECRMNQGDGTLGRHDQRSTHTSSAGDVQLVVPMGPLIFHVAREKITYTLILSIFFLYSGLYKLAQKS